MTLDDAVLAERPVQHGEDHVRHIASQLHRPPALPVDDDGDGLVDSQDSDCTGPRDPEEGSPTPAPQCSDGQDNDADGAIDYPADPGCESAADATEAPDPTQPQLPTSKDQCKNGGWQAYGVFKNQGDCVSYVASGGKNRPTG